MSGGAPYLGKLTLTLDTRHDGNGSILCLQNWPLLNMYLEMRYKLIVLIRRRNFSEESDPFQFIAEFCALLISTVMS